MLTGTTPEEIAARLHRMAANQGSYGDHPTSKALVRAITNDLVFADANLASQMLQDAISHKLTTPHIPLAVLRRLRTHHGALKTLCEDEGLRKDHVKFETVTCDALMRIIMGTHMTPSTTKAYNLLLEVLDG